MVKNNRFSVLIIDDQINWRELLAEILEDEFIVFTAASYQEALQSIQEHRPKFHVVITDLRLDDNDRLNIDGLHIAEALKQIGKQTQVLVITGYPTLDTAKRALKDIEVFDYLEKRPADGQPFNQISFREIVSRAAELAQSYQKDYFTLLSSPILILEADSGWRKRLADLLRRAGYLVDEMENKEDLTRAVEGQNKKYSLALVNEIALRENAELTGLLQQLNPDGKTILLAERDTRDLFQRLRGQVVLGTITLQEGDFNAVDFEQIIQYAFDPQAIKYLTVEIEDHPDSLTVGKTYFMILTLSDISQPGATPIRLAPGGEKLNQTYRLRVFVYASDATITPGASSFWRLFPFSGKTEPSYRVQIQPQKPGAQEIMIELEQDNRWLGRVSIPIKVD